MSNKHEHVNTGGTDAKPSDPNAVNYVHPAYEKARGSGACARHGNNVIPDRTGEVTTNEFPAFDLDNTQEVPAVDNPVLQILVNERWDAQHQGLFASGRTALDLLMQAARHENPMYGRVLALVAAVRVDIGDGLGSYPLYIHNRKMVSRHSRLVAMDIVEMAEKELGSGICDVPHNVEVALVSSEGKIYNKDDWVDLKVERNFAIIRAFSGEYQ